MKALRLAAIAVAVSFASIYALADEVMRITYNDGTTAQFSVASVDNMTFSQAETPAAPTHESVDLGLPSGLLWATCNMGAENLAEYGNYYAWGETELKPGFLDETTVWYNYDIGLLREAGVIDDKNNLKPQYDAATVNWGAEWRMPTVDDINELIANCSWEWTIIDGHRGCLITGPSGNSIFLPASGYGSAYSCLETIYEGDYWTSTAYSGIGYATYLYFDKSKLIPDRAGFGCGMNIRPVREK